jgi:hypothetical protein
VKHRSSSVKPQPKAGREILRVDAGTLCVPGDDWKEVDAHVLKGDHVMFVAFRRSFVVMVVAVGYWLMRRVA